MGKPSFSFSKRTFFNATSSSNKKETVIFYANAFQFKEKIFDIQGTKLSHRKDDLSPVFAMSPRYLNSREYRLSYLDITERTMQTF